MVILAIITVFYFNGYFNFSDLERVMNRLTTGIAAELIDMGIEGKAEDTSQTEEFNARFEEKAKEALAFCEANNFNTDFAILIDMKIHSGKYRMFIYDFNKQEIERQALCAHGNGKDDMKSTGEQPLFSNVEGSWLTSLGKYKIGARSYSRWGVNIHYKLHGLEPSNSNAFERIIVLHSHSPVPADEMYPAHMPMGWSQGCPVTDDETMIYLDAKLQNSEKPVLLWIYY
jgi:hypothetical protein